MEARQMPFYFLTRFIEKLMREKLRTVCGGTREVKRVSNTNVGLFAFVLLILRGVYFNKLIIYVM